MIFKRENPFAIFCKGVFVLKGGRSGEREGYDSELVEYGYDVVKYGDAAM